MATEGQLPGRATRGHRHLDPAVLARWVRRAALPVLLLAALLLYLCFGFVSVPEGMDSIPSIPPGALCLVDKRIGSVRVGSAVFVEVPGGGTLLARVTALGDDGSLTVHKDDARSRLPDSSQFGALPSSCLRGVVLVVFGGRGARGEVIDGR